MNKEKIKDYLTSTGDDFDHALKRYLDRLIELNGQPPGNLINCYYDETCKPFVLRYILHTLLNDKRDVLLFAFTNINKKDWLKTVYWLVADFGVQVTSAIQSEVHILVEGVEVTFRCDLLTAEASSGLHYPVVVVDCYGRPNEKELYEYLELNAGRCTTSICRNGKVQPILVVLE